MNKISSEVHPEQNLRIHTAKGDITVKELISTLAQLYSSGNYNPDMNSLWDLRAASFSSFTQSDISLIKSMVTRQWAKKGRSRSALVVGQENTFRMTQFYRIIMDSPQEKEVKAFHDYNDALKWVREETA